MLILHGGGATADIIALVMFRGGILEQVTHEPLLLILVEGGGNGALQR